MGGVGDTHCTNHRRHTLGGFLSYFYSSDKNIQNFKWKTLCCVYFCVLLFVCTFFSCAHILVGSVAHRQKRVLLLLLCAVHCIERVCLRFYSDNVLYAVKVINELLDVKLYDVSIRCFFWLTFEVWFLNRDMNGISGEGWYSRFFL